MDELRQALRICPREAAARICALPRAERIEEVRFRLDREVSCLLAGREQSVQGLRADVALLRQLLDRATANSAYAAQEMLRQGFLTIPGGHRLGLCGTGVYKVEHLSTLRDVSSVNLRIAHRIPGLGREAAEALWLRPESTLILGPPGRGKTTLLRELISVLSDRYAWRVAVVDERMELAGVTDGRAQFDLGSHTDVLSGVRKAEGVAMLTRAMNPEWIAVDEITAEEDVEAMARASYCGVRFLATAHGETAADLDRRPVYRRLKASGVFRNLLVLLPDRSIRKERLE